MNVPCIQGSPGRVPRYALLADPNHTTKIVRMRTEAARAQLDAIRALTVEERLRVAESLRVFAWELQTSVIAKRHPELSATEVQQRVRAVFGRVVT